MAEVNPSTTNVNASTTNAAGNTSATDDVTILADQVTVMDGYRIAQLQLASAAATAESASLAAEAQRLAAKYGSHSAQAQEAAARLTVLAKEQAALAADLARATLTAPPVATGAFIVYGRVVDSSGAIIAGAQLTAISTAGAPLAKASSSDAGAFVLSVPVKDASGSVTFQVQIGAGGNNTTFPEVFTAVSQRLAFRDFVLPAGPVSTATTASTTQKQTTAQPSIPVAEAPRKITRRVQKPKNEP